MPEAASQGAGAPPTLADEAAALRKTLARKEPWTGLQGKPVEQITVHAMSMAKAWNLPAGSQDDSVQQRGDTHVAAPAERRRDRRDPPPVAQRPRRSRSWRSSRRMRNKQSREDIEAMLERVTFSCAGCAKPGARTRPSTCAGACPARCATDGTRPPPHCVPGSAGSRSTCRWPTGRRRSTTARS